MKHVRVCLTVGWAVIVIVSFPVFCWAAEFLTVHYTKQTQLPAETSTRDEQAIRALIEQYRLGYQLADASRLAATCADFTPALSTALSLYHQSAKNLTVRIGAIRVLAIDNQKAIATFTRQDSFIDARSGKPMRLEVELSKKFVKQNGLWQMFASADAR